MRTLPHPLLPRTDGAGSTPSKALLLPSPFVSVAMQVMQAYSSISESFERYMTGQQQQRSSQQQQQAGDGGGDGQTGAAAERQATSGAAAVPQVPS